MSEPTINDVARMAGVAVSTVSRAFNGGSVKSSTKLAIEAAAAQLGYRGNPTAQGLASGRSRVVGVVVRDFTNYYTTEILASIVDVLQQADYRVNLANVGNGYAADTAIIGNCARAADGIILVSPPVSDVDLPSLCDPNVTVLANRDYPGYSSVILDEATGTAQAMRHLISLGHRCIAYIDGPEYSWTGARRRAAFLSSCADAGVDGVVLGPFEANRRGGYIAADALLIKPSVTAVIAFNDVLASGVLARLVERGKRVPGDYSVIGVDNSLVASTIQPQLTSIDNRQRDIGAAAARMLLRRLDMIDAARRASRKAKDARTAHDDMHPADRHLMLSGTLVIRSSTGPASATEPGGDR